MSKIVINLHSIGLSTKGVRSQKKKMLKKLEYEIFKSFFLISRAFEVIYLMLILSSAFLIYIFENL